MANGIDDEIKVEETTTTPTTVEPTPIEQQTQEVQLDQEGVQTTIELDKGISGEDISGLKKEREKVDIEKSPELPIDETRLEFKKRRRQQIRDKDTDFQTKQRLQKEFSDELRATGPQTTEKKPTGKVETVQDIKAKETANKASEDALNEQNKITKTNEFSQMVQSGATLEELSSFGVENPNIRKDLAVILRDNLKNTANVKYFGKYSTMTNEQLQAEVNAGNIVPGSEQFNLLPENQRAAFKQYQNVNESVNINEKTDFSTGNKIIENTELEQQVPTFHGSNQRQNYIDMINSPERKEAKLKTIRLKHRIEDFEDEMLDRADNIRKELAGSLPGTINAIVRDDNRDAIREKRGLLKEYELSLGEYQTLQDNAKLELDFLKYEDQQARQTYMTELKLHETRRLEKRADLSSIAESKNKIRAAEFLEKNKQQAASLKFKRDLVTKQFDADLKANERSGGKYDVDKDGRKIYILNGVSELVEDANGDVVYSEVDEEKNFKDTVNFKDGIYYTQRAYNDGTVQNFSSDINGDRVGPSLNTIDFIKDSEGFRGKAYQDIAGVWTIGYGFTNIDGKPIQKGDTITEASAEAELGIQISEHSNYENFINVPLSEEQKTALNSFEYNLGKGIWNTTGKEIINAINNGELTKAARIMTLHNKARNPNTGKLEESKGLTNRRVLEANLLKKKFNPASQFSKSAQDWGKQIQRGERKITDIPASETGLRTEVVSFIENNDMLLDEDNPIIQSLKSQFDLIDEIVDWKEGGTGFFGDDTTNESLIEDISGGFQFSPLDSLTGEKGQLLSKIQFLLDEQPLNKLIEVKAQGATFGALSNVELALLTKSASLLNSAAKRNDDGLLTGFRLSEPDLKKHLRILRDGYKKSIETKTGVKQYSLGDITAELDNTAGVGVQDLSNSLDY